jgi:hypothetical protein
MQKYNDDKIAKSKIIDKLLVILFIVCPVLGVLVGINMMIFGGGAWMVKGLATTIISGIIFGAVSCWGSE